MIIGGFGSEKNILLHLINQQDDIGKIHLYAKDLSESKYELLIKNRKNVGNKYSNDSIAFIEYSNTIDEIYENIGHYNPSMKIKKFNCI